MDQILKARKLGSATARRKKMQERERATQLDEERRTRILLYGYSSEEDESSDGGETYSPIPDIQPDRPEPVSTSSYAINCPLTNISKATTEPVPASSYAFPSTLPAKLQIPELFIPEPLTPSFLTYKRTSIPPISDEDDEADTAEPETPIETATPILYSIPRTRPSMISIRTSQDNVKRPMSLPHVPPLPRKSDRRVSAISLRSTSSPVKIPTITSDSLSGRVSDLVRGPHKDIRPRPVTISLKSESRCQFQGPSYDVFPRRSKMASPRRTNPSMIHEEPPQYPSAITPQIVVNARRTSSYPAIHKDTVPITTSSPPRLQSKKSSSTFGQRRSSIGLALRSASSPFRVKNNSRPDTSSSAGSCESSDGIDVSAFPMPPPSPLFHQSFQQQETRSQVASSGSSRMSRVRTTIGL